MSDGVNFMWFALGVAWVVIAVAAFVVVVRK